MDRSAAPSLHPVTKFARFFQGYGIAISLMISALPLVTMWQNVVPVFHGVKPLLTIIASGSCFLLFGVIFAQRHSIARQFFPGLRAGQIRVAHASELQWARLFGWFPALLWICALLCVSFYFHFVREAEERVAYLYAVTPGGREEQPSYKCDRLEPGKEALTLEASLRDFTSSREYRVVITCWVEKGTIQTSPGDRLASYSVQFPTQDSVRTILSGTPSSSVPYQGRMGFFFLGAFVCAASAFVLTGLKDYLQGELELSDADLILKPPIASRKERFDVTDAPGVYGIVEYSPDAPNLAPNLLGPFCASHEKELHPASADPTTGRVTAWKHVKKEGNKVEETLCLLQVQLSIGELERHFRESAEATTEREFSKRG